MLKGIQVFLLTILFFISFSIKAHSGNSAQDCDSVTVYLEAYDKYYDANLDSALHNINRAISISATCQNTEKEVSYILEKARFLV